MAIVLPELGAGGWVKDPLRQLDLLLAHALESDQSQSNIYPGKITSIPYLIARHQSVPLELAEAVEQAMQQYLARYFDSVTCEVNVGEVAEDGRYPLSLAATVKRNGQTYQLAKIAALKDGKILAVIDEVNK